MKIVTIELRTKSDRSGRAISPDNRVKVVIRKHPDIEKAKRLDISCWEAKKIPAAKDDVEFTLEHPDGSVETRTCTKEEFDMFIKPTTLSEASFHHGRQKGQLISSENRRVIDA